MVTEKVQKTLCPTWDQTLIFGEIEIYGNPKGMESNPPDIYIEIFDHDTFVSHFVHMLAFMDGFIVEAVTH